jgi:hypothetical protein
MVGGNEKIVAEVIGGNTACVRRNATFVTQKSARRPGRATDMTQIRREQARQLPRRRLCH